MKRFLIAAALASASFITPALAADVSVSAGIGEPGFYGQLDIGGYPQPQVIYAQPRVVMPVPMDRPPIYLRVPQDQARHWKRYCAKYNACGERVYFVKDDWYNREYAPRYQEQRRSHPDEHRDDRRDEHRDGHREGDRIDHEHEH